MAKEIITELEVLFTANTQQVDKAAKGVQDKAQKIERSPAKQKIDGDAKGALDSMDRVEAEAKKIVSAKTIATVDANIAKAETGLTKVRDRLDYLRSVESTMEVTADIKRAETALKQIERRRDGLVSARESMVIDADTAPAEAALKDVADKAGAAGSKAGDDAGEGLSAGIIGALATIPIAGAVVGIGAAIGKSLLDGLQVEVRSDRLMATTGLDAATVGKLARAAGEAYASNWGESLEANMDTARLAIQQGLLDPDVTARDSEKIIASLAGVADIISGDVSRTSQAAATLIRSGLAKDSAAAFDIIVKGYQAGNDKAEDWLDTLIEYPVVLKKLGITGAEATGLINQGLEAGARNSDVVADALKEFQIRATDASTASAAGYERIGLSAQEMTAKIAAGGDGAREGLQQVLDGLRAMEDPVARNAAAVELFGTKAEDLGDALFSLDLSSAVDELGAVEGAAASAMDALAGNAAGDISSAQRNIEVAADGIKGALAAAFNPQIEGFAEFVSENREQIMQFLLDLANGGLNAARGFVEFSASSAESLGGFVAGPLADVIDGVASLLNGLDKIPGVDTGDAEHSMRDLAESMRGADDTAGDFADNIRTNLITNGINPMQDKLNEVAIPLVAQAAFHDASMRLANDLDAVGYSADGSEMEVSTLSDTVLRSTDAGKAWDDQIQAVVAGLEDQAQKASESGVSQEELTATLQEGRDALIAQLEAMGWTHDEAVALADAYKAFPEEISTNVVAETKTAQFDIDDVIRRNDGRRIAVVVDAVGGNAVYSTAPGNKFVQSFEGAGHVLQPMAMGGLDPMEPVAQMVPPNTWRVVGDRMDVDELYAPLDGSPRSWRLLLEGLRRMPGVAPMAEGALVSSASPSRGATGGSLVGLVLEGTLDLGNGLVGQMRGVVRDELAAAGAAATYRGRA